MDISGPSRAEWAAIALGAGVVTVYAGVVLPWSGVAPGAYLGLLSIYLKGAFALWTMVALAALLCAMVIADRREGGTIPGRRLLPMVIEARWRRDRFASLFWPPILFALLMSLYNSFKQFVLVDAGFPWDAPFADIDRALFLGHEPWRVAHALLGGPTGHYIVGLLYHGWYLPMSLGLILCAFAGNFVLRTQYILTYIGVWVLLGSVLAIVFASAGPCYFDLATGSDRFAPMMAELHAQRAALADRGWVLGADALDIQAALRRLHGGGTLTIGGGISAFPSVHCGLAALFACAAFGIRRWLGWVTTAYAALIWLGSIYLGWHYAIDGLAAFAIVVPMWHLTGRIARRLAALGEVASSVQAWAAPSAG